MNRNQQLARWFIQATKAAWLPPYMWSIENTKNKKHTMEVLVDDKYLSVVLKVADRFWSFEPKKQLLYMAHELWHVIANRADRAAEEAIQRVKDLDDEADTIARLDRQYSEESEKLADHAANLLMPILPEWNGVVDEV